MNWEEQDLKHCEEYRPYNFLPPTIRPKAQTYVDPKFNNQRHDFQGWAELNYGTRRKAEETQSVERTNGTIGWSTMYSVPPDDYVSFIHNYIICTYFYQEHTILDESVSKPVFRWFVDFDVKDTEPITTQELYKMTAVASFTFASFFPELKKKIQQCKYPTKAHIDPDTGDWTLEGDEDSAARLCTLVALTDPKPPKMGPNQQVQYERGIHLHSIGNLYVTTKEARAIRRMMIANFLNPRFGLKKRSLEEWKKIVDLRVYGNLEADNSEDRRQGGLRLMGSCKVADCDYCRRTGLASEEDQAAHIRQYEEKRERLLKEGKPEPYVPNFSLCHKCHGRKSVLVPRRYMPWIILDGAGHIREEMDWVLQDPFQFVPATLIRTRVASGFRNFLKEPALVPGVGYAEDAMSHFARTNEQLLQKKFTERFHVDASHIESQSDKIRIHTTSFAVCQVSGKNHKEEELHQVVSAEESDGGYCFNENILEICPKGKAFWVCPLESRPENPCKEKKPRKPFKFLEKAELERFFVSARSHKTRLGGLDLSEVPTQGEYWSVTSKEVQLLFEWVKTAIDHRTYVGLTHVTEFKRVKKNCYRMSVCGPGDKYCFRSQREHKSNHVCFLFYWSGMYPSCFGSDKGDGCQGSCRSYPYPTSLRDLIFPDILTQPKNKKFLLEGPKHAGTSHIDTMQGPSRTYESSTSFLPQSQQAMVQKLQQSTSAWKNKFHSQQHREGLLKLSEQTVEQASKKQKRD
jgi:hypothetical protein